MNPKVAKGKHKPGKPLSGARRIAFLITFLYLALVIFSFSPYTFNLDEIKVTLLYSGGSILLFLYLVFVGMGALRLFKSRLLLILLGGYFLVLLISTLAAGKHYSWIGWEQLGFHIAILGGFFCSYGLIRENSDIRKAVFIWMLMGLGTTLFGLFHYAGGFAFLRKIFIAPQDRLSRLAIMLGSFERFQDEMFSTILNRQFYAAFLVMLLPFAGAYALVEGRSHFRRYLGIAATILMGICLYLAHSKASSGAAVIMILAFFILYRKYAGSGKIRIPHLGIWAIGLLVIILTLMFFTSDVGGEKFKTVERSVASRAIIWKGAVDMFLHGPGPDNWYELEESLPLSSRSLLIGCGPGSFRLIFPRYRSPDYHLHDISNVTLFSHNQFLDLLAETGILGFLFYVGFLLVFFMNGLRALKRFEKNELRVYAIAFLCSILGLMLSNIFSPNARWPIVAVNLWALLGFGFACFELCPGSGEGRDFSQTTGKRRIAKRGAPLPMPAALFWSLVLLVIPAVFLCAKHGINYFRGAVYNNSGLYHKDILIKMYENEIERLSYVSSQNPEKSKRAQEQIEKYKRKVMENYKQSIVYFRKAVSANPFYITSYYKLANACSRVGDEDKSLETYLTLGKYAPDYSEIHYNLGAVYDTKANQIWRRMKKDKSLEQDDALVQKAKAYEQKALLELKIAARMSNKPERQKAYGQVLYKTKN